MVDGQPAVSTDGAEQRQALIRFAHVDAAGIVFYPRYIELLAEAFPEIPFSKTPFCVTMEFHKSNKLGETVQFVRERTADADSWQIAGLSVTGNKTRECLQFRCDPNDTQFSPSPQRGFSAQPFTVGSWEVDHNARLQLSRYYERVNATVEQWFDSALNLPFAQMHSADRNGIPTVSLRTQVCELPALDEHVFMRIAPTRIGRRSIRFTSSLWRDSTLLAQTEQVVVFIILTDAGFQSADIPCELRARLDDQLNTAAA